MATKQPEESKVFAIGMQSGFVPSIQLQAMLSVLSDQQAAGVRHIALGRLKGRSLTAILLAPDRPCSYSTFWSKKRNGWVNKPRFVAALNLMQQEIRAFQLVSAVDEAVEELKVATVDAAHDLHRQITGDIGAIETLGEVALDKKRGMGERITAVRALGEIGSQIAVEKLLMALNETQSKGNSELRSAVIEELGRCGAATNSQRRLASTATLDRAAKATAAKSDIERTAEEMSDDELESIARGSSGGSTGITAPETRAPASD